jgi:thiol-disulfide isomerase/thioredoxin
LAVRIAGAALLAATAVVGCSRGTAVPPRELVLPAERRAAPPLRGTTIEGRPYDGSALRGAVAVVNVWGSWCGPCKKEQPELNRAAAAHPEVRFLGIAVRDEPAAAAAHARRYGVPYPSLLDEGSRIVASFRDLPPAAVPSTILLDRQGRVAALLIGATDAAELDGLLRRLRAEP